MKIDELVILLRALTNFSLIAKNLNQTITVGKSIVDLFSYM